MSINKQKDIWDKNWKDQINIDPQKIINSHFTQEAFYCLKNFIDERKDKIILEAGCGTGRFCCLLAKNFPNSKVIGKDISPNSLKIANSLKEYLKISNVSFGAGNLFQILYPNDYFDVVFNEGVIEHYSFNNKPNYIDAAREMIRVTKKSGKIIIVVPNWYNFPHTLYKWTLNKLGKRFIYGYEKSFKYLELKKIFSDLGLGEIEVSGFYPSYGFYRISGEKYRKIFYFLGKLTDILLKYPDKITNNYFTKKFGFEIMIKGVKS
ncbi:MAG: class I SAM-dependent methyltransferase [Candidatus Lokiarchaeota archaeon]|nr:class I SAM-dependent methyltransferase [Candidatus Lokiarchaeota archaeon]